MKRLIDQNLPQGIAILAESGPSLSQLNMHPKKDLLARGAKAPPPRRTTSPGELLH